MLASSDSSECETPSRCPPTHAQLEELRRENALLKSQFEEAVAISSQMEKLHEQNTALVAQVRDLKAERDDLEHRLEISVQSNRELTAKLAEHKQVCTCQRGLDMTSMDKELSKLKKASRAQIDEVCRQREQAQEDLEQERVEKKMVISKLDRIIQAAERRFRTKFETAEDLLTVLEAPEVIQSEPAPPAPPKEAVAAVKKAKKMRANLEKEVAMREKAEGDAKRAMKQCHDAEIANKQKVAQLERQIAHINDEREATDVQHRCEVSRLEAKVDGLQADLARSQAKLKKARTKFLAQAQPAPQPQQTSAQQPQQSPAPVEIVVKKTDQKDKAKKEKLRRKIAELSEKLTCAEAKKVELADRLCECETDGRDLELAFEKQKVEFTALQRVHDEALLEIATLREALHAKEQLNKEAAEAAKKLRKPCPKMVQLEKTVDKQKQKIYALEIANNKQQTIIEEKDQRLRDAAATQEELEGTIRKQNEEVRSLQAKVNAIPKPTAEDLIPPEAFYVADLEPKLSAKLMDIARNPSLQPTSKLQNGMKTVVKHYKGALAARDEALDQAYRDNQALSDAFGQFLVDSSIAVTEKPVTLQDFFQKSAGTELIAKIVAMRNQCNDLKHKCESQANVFEHFAKTFAGIVENGADPVKQITDVKQKLDSQASQLIAREKKARALKAELAETQAKAKNTEEELTQQVDDLKAETRQLNEEKGELEENLSQMKTRCQNLAEELDNANQTRVELESTMIEDHEEKIQALQEEFGERARQMQAQITDLSAKCEELAQAYKDGEALIAKQKKAIHNLRAAKKQRDVEYDELVKACAAKEEAAAIRLEEEKKNVTETYERALAELHNQCEAHRADVEKLSAALTQSENATSSAKVTILKLQKENKRLACELESFKGQLDRERKLMETNVRTSKIAAESHYAMKLEEQKAKAEAEIRKLCAAGADAFRDFFDANEQLSERSFRALLEKAHDELARLSKSDAAIRRIVKAGERQTTEDAVAQAVMRL